MHVKQAAIQVLQQTGGPLTARRICEHILGQGLWNSQGSTPEATVAARLYSVIKNVVRRSQFVARKPANEAQ